MTHRIGIIGAGDISRKTYLPLLAKRGDCELAAICGKTTGPASELATEYGIKHVYDDVNELLARGDIDTVFICTPTETHFTIAKAALKQGKNILIEKPLTAIYADDVSLLKLARSQPKTFYVAFNNSFREENQWLSRQVQAESMGHVQMINLDWYRAMPFTSGGVLMHLGAKLLHFALGLLPDRRSFTATCQNLRRCDVSNSGEATSISTIVIDESVSINMRLGWDMELSAGSRVDLDIFCKKGQVSNCEFKGDQSDGYGIMIGEFLERCASGKIMKLDLLEDTAAVVDALYRSDREQATVTDKFVLA